MSVAIIRNDFFDHGASWSKAWLAACEELGITYELIDWRAPAALARMLRHKMILWHFNNYSAAEMSFARLFLNTLEHAGCCVFPGFVDSWHFDDKIAQSFLLESVGAPTPRNHIFFSMESLESWLDEAPTFPIVAKLRTGSGSSNVRLLETSKSVRTYATQMFGRGMSSAPGAIFKLSSNLRSSKTLHDVVTRAKRAPEFLQSLIHARSLPRERGYVYLQEFIPDASYDIKVVVVSDKLSFIGRRIRKGDFRASGGGDLFYDRSIINDRIIEAAFCLADAMRSVCVGFDFVVDPRTDEPFIVEISYGFSHKALFTAAGYYDRSGDWHQEPLNAPLEIVKRHWLTSNGRT